MLCGWKKSLETAYTSEDALTVGAATLVPPGGFGVTPATTLGLSKAAWILLPHRQRLISHLLNLEGFTLSLRRQDRRREDKTEGEGLNFFSECALRSLIKESNHTQSMVQKRDLLGF